MDRPTEVREWLDHLGTEVRAEAEELSVLISTVDARLEQAIKWGRPTFTMSGDWHHWLCAIAATKKGAKAVFHKGVLLEDPEGLMTGSGRYVREVSAAKALRCPEATAALVRSAISHQTDMLD